MFKNLLSLFMGFFLLSAGAFAQITNYVFTATTGTYTNITGTSAVLLASCSSITDEGYANAVPIGFPFIYNGISYSTINASTNGLATFGNAFTGGAAGTACNYDNEVGGLSGFAASRPILAPFWDDLDVTGGVQYSTTGTAPNRVFTLQFKSAKWDYSAAAASLSMQIKLYETTNVVEFIYFQEAGATANLSGGAAIGISAVGTGSGNFLSLNNAGAAPTVSSTTVTNNIGTRPATNQIYRFTPPAVLSYCIPTVTDPQHTLGEKIGRVQMGAIDNSSTSTAAYEDFTSRSTAVIAGGTQAITVTLQAAYFADQVLVWVDLNQDGDFIDAGELLYTSAISAGPHTTTLTIPASATLGKTRMRVRLWDTSAGPAATPCGATDWGQTEDYTLYIYCSAGATDPSHTLGEKIGNVKFGSINNTSTSTAGYENFVNISATMQRGTATNPITVTLANPWIDDQVYVWIDFNQDGDFTDAGELVYTSTIGNGPHTGNINLPASALLGATRMRIRLQDTGSPPTNNTPCGTSAWGQTEDYTIVFVDCQAASISTQPANTTLCNNGNGTISLVAAGSGLTYQWQVSTNGGTSWTNLTNGGVYTGTTTTTLTLTGATTALNSYQYRVLINGTCTPANTPSGAATLTINAVPVITTQPTLPTSPLCETGSVTLNVAASGNNPTFKWQVSTDGGTTWTDVSGATNASFTLSGLNPSMNNRRYRAVATVAPCAGVNSNSVAITVNPQPSVTISTPVTKLTPLTTTTLSATVSPTAGTYTYQWFRNGTLVPGTGATRVVNIDGVGEWQATVTSSFGCISVKSNTIMIGDSATSQLFVYPNPNRGIFYIRYYTEFFSYNPNPGLNIALIRTINVFDSRGQLVLTRKLSASHSWGRMDVNMTEHPKGTYYIELGDVDGRRLTTTTVVIQ